MPRSYGEALRDFGQKAGLPSEDVERLQGMARLHNLLAHEYLDLLYERIRLLIDEMPPVYDRLLALVDRFLAEG